MDSYLLVQFVVHTKNSNRSIEASNEIELYKYISEIVKEYSGKAYAINGMPDHIHILANLSPAISIDDYMKKIKASTSLWMKDSGNFPKFDGWHDGYSAFGYCMEDKDNLVNYIMNQKEHHQSETFVDEYKRLLTENGIDFDEHDLF